MSLTKTEENPEKPKLRGLIHLIMSPISLVAGIVLITAADRLQGRITLGIFTLTAVTLFTCSAIYHRIGWKPKAKALWRRIDHANITILIAGSYTPFAIYLLSHKQALILLSLGWGGAILTAILRILWLGAPRWLYVIAYIALGWAAVFYLPTFWQKGGVAVFVLIAAGGICYTAGGIIYALKKPNFSINWFGFHELFHAFTAAAFALQFIAAALVIFQKS
jgi:hemolysin III